MTLIKREDAIDELRHLIPYKTYHRGKWVRLLEKEEVFKALNSLPSAEANFTDGNKISEWIPCSERLPMMGDELNRHLHQRQGLRHHP